MNTPIYDLKGRHIGYRTTLQPTGETIVVRPQSVTNKINDAEYKEACERILRNRAKGR